MTKDYKDLPKITTIAARAEAMYRKFGLPLSRSQIVFSILGCHDHACPLDLDAFSNADDSNFAHDVGGIVRHYNPKTHTLDDCFLPRFAAI